MSCNVFQGIKIPDNYENESMADLQMEFRGQFSSIKTQFTDFLKRANETLKMAVDETTKRTSNDPETLQHNITVIETILASVASCKADAESWVEIYRMLFFCPKKATFSESDRKQYTTVKTIVQSNLLNQLSYFHTVLEKRISSLQSRLKYQTEAFKRA